MKTTVSYQIKHGNGISGGHDDQFHYHDEQSAIESAEKFKNNPRDKSPSMSDSNVEYWKNETFTVVKVETTVTHIKTI